MSYVRRFLDAFNRQPAGIAKAELALATAVLAYAANRLPNLAWAIVPIAGALRSFASPHPESADEGLKSDGKA